jgi:ribonuclease P/MRP protein subunit POP3
MPPAIKSHLLVGLNSVTRHLEALAAKNAPSTAPAANLRSTQESPTEKVASEDSPVGVLRPLSMVILTHPKPSLSPAHAHLPTLVHLSTVSSSPATPSTATRLIPIQTSADARLASSLHIPCVGALAIYEGAPEAKTLEEYVREHIGLTECKWVDEAMSAEWKGLNVKSVTPGTK